VRASRKANALAGGPGRVGRGPGACSGRNCQASRRQGLRPTAPQPATSYSSTEAPGSGCRLWHCTIPGSTYVYPVNGADQQRGIGPLLGRYPGDVYDGDTDTQAGDHPWAVSTANFAELYYRLAAKIIFGGTVPSDSLSAGFFSQVGVNADTTPAAAAAALQAAGDQMLQAVIFHSDNLELSEQFDATTGYEKSVSNLSWSYASFLSAVRARTAI
jgi:hypothetical protein